MVRTDILVEEANAIGMPVEALDASRVIAVVGAGAMGAGIAQVAAAAGHTVTIFDVRAGAAESAAAGVRATFWKLVDKGRLAHEAAAQACDRLRVADDIADLSGAGLVVEAIVEDLEAKRRLFADLEAVVADDCILASNTSSISISAIAARLRRPGRFLGMHFFNPAPLMALVEVVSGLGTDERCARVVAATAQAWGKSPVHARSTPGFIVNRVARPYYAEALRLLAERASDVPTIDAILRECGGFRMGPFELMDLIGHDVNYAVTRSVFDAFYNDPRFTPSLIQLELVNSGRLGRKTGHGFYRYDDAAPAPVVPTEPGICLPSTVVAYPAHGGAQALTDRLEMAGVWLTQARQPHADGRWFDVDGCALYQTDGRSATRRAADLEIRDVCALDLMLDATYGTRIACAFSDQCSASSTAVVAGLLRFAGFSVSRIDDVPGLVVMRTVAMLANEAADAVNQGVCDAAAADLAMRKGVNYPRGPLEWADAIGLSAVMTVLDHLASAYGEDRYRCSPLIRRKVLGDARFHT